MGGNVIGINKTTLVKIKAEKIDLIKFNRQEFINQFTNLFKKLNSLYIEQYTKPLWINESQLDSNELYNGSTSYIMNRNITDDELLKYKTSCGDLDLIVPDDSKENLWNLLDSLENKEIIPGITYHGCNKLKVKSIGDQINSIFITEFNGYKVNAQVDFEFLSVDSFGKPSEISKFGHSSSFTDAKQNIKAVMHKYIIFAISGAIDVKTNIALATKTSSFHNLKISKSKYADSIRMLKFDLNKGISIAYEQMKDENNNPLYFENKLVYKEIPTISRKYYSTVHQMSQLCFNKTDVDDEKFWSFVGILDLIKEHIQDDKVISKIHDRFFEKMFGTETQKGQVLEVGNAKLDYQVKIAGYCYFCESLNIPVNHEKIKSYYDIFDSLRGGKLKCLK